MTAPPNPSAPSPAVIGVVLLNWHGASDTIECLDSLLASDPPPDHVIVVDNGSTDDSLARLTEWARACGRSWQLHEYRERPNLAAPRPWLVILKVGHNRGFAGGNNPGLAWLGADRRVTHLMLLNNDTLVAHDAFGALHDALERVPSAGLVTGTIFERDGHTVWYAGGSSLPLRALVLHEYAIPADDAPRETEFISGCAMVISRDAYERVGPLAECYFPLYMEDAEYSWRARAAGFPVIYAPAMRIVHKVGATVGAASTSPRVSYCQNRHRAFYVRRNMRGLQRLGALGYLAITKPGRAVVETLRGRPSIGWAILRGTAAGFVSDEAYSPRDPTPR